MEDPLDPESGDSALRRYSFVHDRIRQMAYESLAETDRSKLHHRIGKYLQQTLPNEDGHKQVFEIVEHLILGRDHIVGEEAGTWFAEICLLAARQSRLALAIDAGRGYLAAAMEKMPGDLRGNNHALAYELMKEKALADSLAGYFQQSETILTDLLDRADDPGEKSELQIFRINNNLRQMRFKESVHLGLAVLRDLGLAIPDGPLKWAVKKERTELDSRLAQRTIASLFDLPDNPDRQFNQLFRVVESIIITVSYHDLDLYAYLILKCVNLSLSQGHSPDSVPCFSACGFLLAFLYGDFETGYEFGQLGLQLCRKFNKNVHTAEMILSYYLNFTRLPLKGCLRCNEATLENARRVGALHSIVVALYYSNLLKFYMGEPIRGLLSGLESDLRIISMTKNPWGYLWTLEMANTLRELAGKEPDNSHRPRLEDNQYLGSNIFIFNALSALFLNEPAEALEGADLAITTIQPGDGICNLIEAYFIQSLAMADLYHGVSPDTQATFLNTMAENQSKYRAWSDGCPENFLAKYLLVEAERARVDGRVMEAMDLYDQAIETAREGNYPQYEALANEMAGRFWQGRGKPRVARMYLLEAYSGYEKWGACRVLERIREEHPGLFSAEPDRDNPKKFPPPIKNPTGTGLSKPPSPCPKS